MYAYNNFEQRYLSQAVIACHINMGEVYIDVLYNGRHQFAIPVSEVKRVTDLKTHLQETIEDTCGMQDNPPDRVWYYNDHEDDVPITIAQAYRQLCAALGDAYSVQTAFVVTEQELFDDAYGTGCVAALQDTTPWYSFIGDSFADLLQEILEQAHLFKSSMKMQAIKSYLVERADAIQTFANPIGPMHKVEALSELVNILDHLNIYRNRQ